MRPRKSIVERVTCSCVACPIPTGGRHMAQDRVEQRLLCCSLSVAMSAWRNPPCAANDGEVATGRVGAELRDKKTRTLSTACSGRAPIDLVDEQQSAAGLAPGLASTKRVWGIGLVWHDDPTGPHRHAEDRSTFSAESQSDQVSTILMAVSPVGDGRVLGENGDPRSPLPVVGVIRRWELPHRHGRCRLLLHQGSTRVCFAVVNVGYDRDIANPLRVSWALIQRPGSIDHLISAACRVRFKRLKSFGFVLSKRQSTAHS